MRVGFLRGLLTRASRPAPELAGLAALVGLVAGVTAGLARGDVGFAAMSSVLAWPDPAAGVSEATTTTRPASSSTTTTVAGQPAGSAGIGPTPRPREHGASRPATTRTPASPTTAPGTSAIPIDTGPPGTVGTTTREVTTTSVAPSTTPTTTTTSASTTTTTAVLKATTSTLDQGDR
jgi:hypothetical protein